MGVKNKLTFEEKKNRRLMKWLMTLNREQKELLTEYCNEQSKSDIVAHFYAYERVLRPVLYSLVNNDILEAEKILAEIVKQVGMEGLTYTILKMGAWNI